MLNYNLQNKDGSARPGSAIIGGNMAGRTPRQLAREFAAARSLKPNLGRAIAHHSLSAPPGIKLSDPQWQIAAANYLKQMGYGDSHQYTIIKHTDTAHEHVHIVSSRIALDGKVVSDSNDRKRSHEAAAKAALSIGLTPVPPPDKTKPRVRISRNQVEQAQGLGSIHPKLTIAARLDVAVDLARDYDQFKANAQKLGVEVREASNEGGVYGLSYALTNPPPGFRATAWKGSTIGPGYSFKHIERRLGGEGLDQIKQARQYKTVLDFAKAETVGKKKVHRWENGAVAAISTQDTISFRNETTGSIKLAARLAQEMGWKEVHLGGSEERRRLAAIEYQKLGIEVINPLEQIQNGKPTAKATTAGQSASSRLDGRHPPAPKISPAGSTSKEPQKTNQNDKTEERAHRMAEIDPLEFLKNPAVATANATAATAEENEAATASARAQAKQEHQRLTAALMVDRQFWDSMFRAGGVENIDQRAKLEAERRAAEMLNDPNKAQERELLLAQLIQEEKEQRMRAEKVEKSADAKKDKEKERQEERQADPLKPGPRPKG